MNVEHLLKQLNKIRPDANYAQRSRDIILQMSPLPVTPRARVMRWLADSVQFGSAMALTGLLLLVLAGGFSVVFNYLTNFNKLASLNPAGIQAEAQAVDMQLQLAKVNYEEGTSTDTSSADKKIPAITVAHKLSQLQQASDTGNAAAMLQDMKNASETQQSVDIDEALSALSSN